MIEINSSDTINSPYYILSTPASKYEVSKNSCSIPSTLFYLIFKFGLNRSLVMEYILLMTAYFAFDKQLFVSC